MRKGWRNDPQWVRLHQEAKAAQEAARQRFWEMKMAQAKHAQDRQRMEMDQTIAEREWRTNLLQGVF